MSHVLAAIRQHARTRPDKTALLSGANSLSYSELAARIETLAVQLRLAAPRMLGLQADNGIDWVLADLAALQAGIPIVPLPGYFSPAQLQHTLQRTGVDLLLTDLSTTPAECTEMKATGPREFYGTLNAIEINIEEHIPARLPPDTQKITFTSGTTGQSKGVCLSTTAIERVAHAIQEIIAPTPEDRHLCVLPLATLLENIAGVYVSLLAGATCMLPPLAEVGLFGSSSLDIATQLHALEALQASSAILVPQMLAAQVAAISAGAPLPQSLRFLAVGGGSVAPNLLKKALTLGLPVHEGYGLSECASVVALNRPGESRPGCVGRALPHVRIEIASDGEIIVHGAGFAGYLGDPVRDPAQPLLTGDLGHLDEHGCLHISGRKKNMFITSFGRNVSPEWIERELQAQPGLLQAVVFGEARPFNVAVIVPHSSLSPMQISAAVMTANADLPDYAKVSQWIVADTPFSPANGQLTANGRPRRSAIATAYASQIEVLYQGNEPHGVLRRVA